MKRACIGEQRVHGGTGDRQPGALCAPRAACLADLLPACFCVPHPPKGGLAPRTPSPAVHDAVNAVVLPLLVTLIAAGLVQAVDPRHVTHAMLAYTAADFVWVALQVGAPGPHLLFGGRPGGRQRRTHVYARPQPAQPGPARRCSWVLLAVLPPLPPASCHFAPPQPEAVPSLPLVILFHHVVTAVLLAFPMMHPRLHW